MSLYLFNMPLRYPMINRELTTIFEDYGGKRIYDENKKILLLEEMMKYYGLYESEIVFHGTTMTYLNPDSISDLPRPVYLTIQCLLPPEFKVIVECSEDVLMMMKLKGNKWVESGCYEVSEDHLSNHMVRGI